jgi:spore maturation protein CgeB
VRLFEAASCKTPIISDIWDGINTLLAPGREIVLAQGPDDVLGVLDAWPQARRTALGEAAHQRILAEHTAAHRAGALENGLREAMSRPRKEYRLAMGIGV